MFSDTEKDAIHTICKLVAMAPRSSADLERARVIDHNKATCPECAPKRPCIRAFRAGVEHMAITGKYTDVGSTFEGDKLAAIIEDFVTNVITDVRSNGMACPLCGRRFKTQGGLDGHLGSYHKSKPAAPDYRGEPHDALREQHTTSKASEKPAEES